MKTYKFYSPYSSGSYSKKFKNDDAALRYASESDDSAKQTQVSKQMECFWNVEYQCWLPSESFSKVKQSENKLLDEIALEQRMNR